MAVSLVVAGMQLRPSSSEKAPLADAFTAVGQSWATLISIGAIAGLTTVVMILMLGRAGCCSPCAATACCRGGWRRSTRGSARRTGSRSSSGWWRASLSGFIPLGTLAELVNIGTLFAFVVVVRRCDHPAPYAARPAAAFRTPLVPVLPILSVLACIYLMLNLPVETWLRFVIWMIIGAVLYFVYGYRHSRVEAPSPKGRRPDAHPPRQAIRG